MKINKLLKSESGVILVTVIIITTILLILAYSVMSINSSQSISNLNQVNRIKAEQLAQGAFWVSYMTLITGGSAPSSVTETMDGKSYTAVISPGSPGAGILGTTQYSTAVSY